MVEGLNKYILMKGPLCNKFYKQEGTKILDQSRMGKERLKLKHSAEFALFGKK